jgi:hypothetical protein
MDVSDGDITEDVDGTPPPWQPLETVLSIWVEMIEIGKVVPAEEDIELSNEKIGQWLWYSYSEKQVQDTVAAFDRLATAIEARMPLQSLHGSQIILAQSDNHLVSASILDSTSIPESCFARDFLTKARKPNFKYIAPGLFLPDDFAFQQPLTTVINDDESAIPVPPVLLFRADTSETYPLGPEHWERNPFCEPYNNPNNDDSTKDIPTGLYSESINRHNYDNSEDGFRFLLPFEVGSHGFVRKSDGSHFEGREELYQHGYQPFGGEKWRAQRLVKLFENWRSMVENGDWEVNGDGVMGGIEKFKEADTEGGWRRYWIESSW